MQKENITGRNNARLKNLLDWLINNHFHDVDLVNPVEVKFGQKTLSRFGSIRLTKKNISRIIINGYFKDEFVPEKIIVGTLAHEMAHYVHGFSSLRPRQHKHPHKGGIIKKELYKRGLGGIYEFEKKWSKNEWREYIKEKFYSDPPSRYRKLVRSGRMGVILFKEPVKRRKRSVRRGRKRSAFSTVIKLLRRTYRLLD